MGLKIISAWLPIPDEYELGVSGPDSVSEASFAFNYI